MPGDLRSVLLLAPAFPPDTDGGGPAQSLRMIAAELTEAGVDVTVMTKPSRVAEMGVAHDAQLRPTRVVRATSWGQVAKALSFREQRFDHIVVSSFWSPISLSIVVLRLLGLLRCGDLVLTPRGQLNPGPLMTSFRRKRVLLPVYRLLYSLGADRIVATSDSEKSAAEAILRRPVVLARQTAGALDFQPRPPRSDRDLSMAFVSRVHPRKGLREALRGLEHASCRVKFFIAGPIQDGKYWFECEQIINRLHAVGDVEVKNLGLIGRAEVESLLGRVDVMILVSSGENFGHTIAEALQVGTPVIIGPDTPWSAAVAADPLAGAVLEYPLSPNRLGSLLDDWSRDGDRARSTRRSACRRVFEESQKSSVMTVSEVVIAERQGEGR